MKTGNKTKSHVYIVNTISIEMKISSYNLQHIILKVLGRYNTIKLNLMALEFSFLYSIWAIVGRYKRNWLRNSSYILNILSYARIKYSFIY